MIIRYLYILSFSFIFQFGSAQDSYSNEELHTFVNVYMSFKTEKKRDTAVDKKSFETYKVTPERYREIANGAVSNEPLDLSLNEELLILELKKHSIIHSNRNEELLKKICSENNISFPKYSSILNQYQKNIQFQRSLKPHFDAYINQLK